ncbi:addiction module protein [Urbifossiella limnaea]|uniref:Addiction module component n=1 Tax=Urbifossiella limnaea TaxID=2528023 RepID=A0A517XLE9_9BACT|nr:addiction module protein [Urbifossiella limnaea]QDU18332.1 Putative addiction module component [Urbifossiella limnaea]
MSVKDAVIEMIRALPDTATWADIAEAGDARFGDPNDENLTREEWEAAWAEEINRRVADIDAGRTKLIPAEEVMARLKAKYG